MAAVMLLPVISWMLPSLDVPRFHLDFLRSSPATDAGSAPAGSQAGFGWSTSGILLGIYLAGTLLVFAWQPIGRAYVYRLRRHACKAVHERITAVDRVDGDWPWCVRAQDGCGAGGIK
jgi:hypothetical protein